MLQCELSGQVLDASTGDAVVTPSGHVCSKRLLLAKLSENGSLDPFIKADQTLTEDQLVVLQAPASNSAAAVAPPPNSSSGGSGGTSFPALLEQVHREYDAVVLELVETRTALQQARQELSQALYQNDAAVRVVARLAAERDAARQALQQWNASAATTSAAETSSNSNKKRRLEEEKASSPAAPDSSSASLPLENDLPDADLQEMTAVWETLHKGRKSQLKAQAAVAPTADQIREQFAKLYVPAVGKDGSSKSAAAAASGLTVMARNENKIVTVGRLDKKLVVWEVSSNQNNNNQLQQKALHVISPQQQPTQSKGAATAVHVTDQHLAAGYSSGQIRVWALSEQASQQPQVLGTLDTLTPVCHVQFHPDGQHVVAASTSGRITIARLSSKNLQAVGIFKPTVESKLTTAALHPDGLIYVVGSAFGGLQLWDLKSKSLASTLQAPPVTAGSTSTSSRDAVTQVAISPNGYHVAAAHAGSGRVCLWDLRKQKVIATLNNTAEAGDSAAASRVLETVSVVRFDPAGKYVAYGGTTKSNQGKICIVPVKEWQTVVATLDYNVNDDDDDDAKMKDAADDTAAAAAAGDSSLSGLEWGSSSTTSQQQQQQSWIATCSAAPNCRQVRFFGIKNE